MLPASVSRTSTSTTTSTRHTTTTGDTSDKGFHASVDTAKSKSGKGKSPRTPDQNLAPPPLLPSDPDQNLAPPPALPGPPDQSPAPPTLPAAPPPSSSSASPPQSMLQDYRENGNIIEPARLMAALDPNYAALGTGTPSGAQNGPTTENQEPPSTPAFTPSPAPAIGPGSPPNVSPWPAPAVGAPSTSGSPPNPPHNRGSQPPPPQNYLLGFIGPIPTGATRTNVPAVKNDIQDHNQSRLVADLNSASKNHTIGALLSELGPSELARADRILDNHGLPQAQRNDGLSQAQRNALFNSMAQGGASASDLAMLAKSFSQDGSDLDTSANVVGVLTAASNAGEMKQVVQDLNLGPAGLKTVANDLANPKSGASDTTRLNFIQALRPYIGKKRGAASAVGTVLLSFKGDSKGVTKALDLFSSKPGQPGDSPGQLSDILGADEGDRFVALVNLAATDTDDPDAQATVFTAGAAIASNSTHNALDAAPVYQRDGGLIPASAASAWRATATSQLNALTNLLGGNPNKNGAANSNPSQIVRVLQQRGDAGVGQTFPFSTSGPAINKDTVLTSYINDMMDLDNNQPITRLFTLLRFGPDNKDDYVYDSDNAESLGYFVGAVQNVIGQQTSSEVQNYSFFSDFSSIFGTLPYAGSSVTAFSEAWATQAENSAETKGSDSQTRIYWQAVYDKNRSNAHAPFEIPPQSRINFDNGVRDAGGKVPG